MSSLPDKPGTPVPRETTAPVVRPRPRRRPWWWLVGGVGVTVLVVALVAIFWRRPSSPAPHVTGVPATSRPEVSSPSPEPRPEVTDSTTTPQPAPVATAAAASADPAGGWQPRPGSGLYVGSPSEHMVERLHAILLNHGLLNEEQAGEINELLAGLTERGETTIPVIRDFLERGENLNFNTFPGGTEVAYPTLRVGLLDVLLQIGTPDALAVVSESLVNAIDPVEIGLVTHELERQLPGQYRELALAAASDVLISGVQTVHDTAPLFEILETYGGAGVTNQLVQAATHYGRYAAIALGNLPDGVGIPALVQLAHDPETAAAVVPVLADLAVRQPAAHAALCSHSLLQEVPDNAWPAIAATLAGQRPVRYRSPLLTDATPAADTAVTDIQQRLTLVSQLMAATANPAAQQALQQARTELLQRLR